jgi:hypothetical protein
VGEVAKPGVDNSIDAVILRMCASHSPEEISRHLGGTVSPARVAAQVQTLLKSKTWLSQAQEEQQLMWELRDVLNKMRSKFEDLDNLKAQLGVLKVIGSRFDSRSRANEEDLNSYSTNVGREMARGYDIALSYMKGALREHIDPEVWDEAAREGLYHAQAEILKKAVED